MVVSASCFAMLISGAFCASAQAPDFYISEVDYDQPGTDTHEWVEIHNGAIVEIQAEGLFLVLYDRDLSGSCHEYCRVDLSSLVLIPEESYIVIGNHSCARLPLCTATDAIQNNVPSGIAIVGPGGVIDSVEYGSDLVHSVCNFEPTPVRDRDSMDGSIQFCIQSGFPYHGTWSFTTASTPCASNSCTTSDVPPFPITLWGFVKSLYE